eukprot:GHUV01043827.1.p1 GENE.GHUV01043827.1~~GHUV01043827.1.p1  ORF type:complete len:116 (-),score=36.02 GHUV01043827.1:134-481(-)
MLICACQSSTNHWLTVTTGHSPFRLASHSVQARLSNGVSPVWFVCCRYFCLASRQPLPVSIPSSCGPCQATPALLLQFRDAGVDQQIIQAAAQQHLVRGGASGQQPGVSTCMLRT